MCDEVCRTGKQMFRNPGQAARAKRALQNRRNARQHNDLRPYLCPYCRHWHLAPYARVTLKTEKRRNAKLIERNYSGLSAGEA